MANITESKVRSWLKKAQHHGIQFDSHVRLFVEEGTTQMELKDYTELVNRFVEDPRVKKEFKDSWVVNERKAKRKLFFWISYFVRPEDKALTALISIILRCQDKDIDKHLGLEGLKTLEFYKKFFVQTGGALDADYKMDRISMGLEPVPIIDYLETLNVQCYEKMIERVREYVKKRNIAAGASYLLRQMLYTSDAEGCAHRKPGEWFYDFMAGCKTHPYTTFIPRYLDPNWKETLSEYRASKAAQEKIFVPMNEDMISPDFIPTGPREQKEYKHYRSVLEQYVELQPDNYDLYPYQIELIAHAINGKNTIICAPTGSGKTMIATELIKKHLIQKEFEKKTGRVVMLVPTVPLVEQQTDHFIRYIGGTRYMDGISGAEDLNDKAGHLLACEVVVMTPQILINMLNSLLKKEKVYIADFTLIIFDECHHCNERHPYKIIMEMLEDAKDKLPPETLPQIVGLTASMGVGQTSWNVDQCREHMLKLCSNLMAETISTVRHQIDDLKQKISPPVDSVQRAERPKNDYFTGALREVMLKIQNNLGKDLNKLVETGQIPLKREDIMFPEHDNWARYQNVVGNIKMYVDKLKEPHLRFPISRQIQQLSYYFHAVGINDLLPEAYTLEYLESKIGSFFQTLKASNDPEIEKIHMDLRDTYRNFHDTHMKPIYSKPTTTKPILTTLYKILRDEFTADPETTCLIFVATRSCANNLAHHLTNVKELPMFYGLNNVGYMVSSNQTSISGGQSKREQEEMQQKFRNKSIKVLVVTSVAEEGIDIAECNLIIKYNSVGSERTLIQRRGRARKANSKSILLALDTAIEQQEFANIRKEALMYECIRDLQEHEDETLRRMIAEKSKSLRRERLEAERRQKQQHEILSKRRYKLNCKICGNFICESFNVRHLNGTIYVCCDQKIWDRSVNKIIAKPTKDNMTTICAEWHCLNCNEQWGRVLKYSNVFLPALTPNAFSLQRMDTQDYEVTDARAKLQWTRIQSEFFNIDPITVRNMTEMHTALVNKSRKEYEDMQRQEYIANRRLREKMAEFKAKERARRQQLLLDE